MRIRSLLLLLVLASIGAAAQSYAVVANDIGVSAMTSAELRLAFKPKNAFWSNRKPVVIVLPGTSNPIREEVARNVYNTSFVAMQKYWLSLVFQGRFGAPVILNSDEETLNYVRKTPGAIGFLSDPSLAPPGLLVRIQD